MLPEKKPLCEKLEQLLSHKSINLPFNRKISLYGNPGKVEWIKENLKIKNQASPKYDAIMQVINDILN